MTAPIIFEARDLPAMPGFRDALCDWLRAHHINPDQVISFEVRDGQPQTVTALLVALNADGKPYPEPGTGLLATEVTGAMVIRDLPKPEDFEHLADKALREATR